MSGEADKEAIAAAGERTIGEELNQAAADEETSTGEGKRLKKKKGEKRPKKGGGSKKKLLALPVLGLLVVLAGFTLKLRSGAVDKSEPQEPAASSEAASSGAASSGEPSKEAASSGAASSGAASSGAASGEAPEAPAEPAAEENILTMSESVDYIHTLSPEQLGLEGESMDDFELLPSEGLILVDGEPCTEIMVYRRDPKTGTNVFQGSYLLDRSGSRLYRLDRDSNAVTELLTPGGMG